MGEKLVRESLPESNYDGSFSKVSQDSGQVLPNIFNYADDQTGSISITLARGIKWGEG